jgi:hypothetical protein
VLGRLGGRSSVPQTDEEINALDKWCLPGVEIVDKMHAFGKE